MRREVIVTADGSHSVSIPEMNVMYHSIHGAVQESMHVFIEAGLRYWFGRFDQHQQCNIFEMGYGTGLNALLTFAETQKNRLNVHYTSIELFPLKKEEFESLNYCEALERVDLKPSFQEMHESKWETDIHLSPSFTLFKTNQSLLNFKSDRKFDIVYFDAFDPAAQPELWTQEVFHLLYSMMNTHAVLTTYCSKGNVRRVMLAAGFTVEKIPGPPHKREMLRAIKNEPFRH